MGKTARDVSEAEAWSHVFGYCTGNDFSARDLQFESNRWMAVKNGQVRQSSNTSRMIFDCRKLVSFISQRMTLRPATSSSSDAGRFSDWPPLLLEAG